MLNTPLISDLIFKGEVSEIKEIMKKSRNLGMQTFDQALFDMYENNVITYEDALRNADSVNDLRLQIKLNSQRAKSPTCRPARSTSRSCDRGIVMPGSAATLQPQHNSMVCRSNPVGSALGPTRISTSPASNKGCRSGPR